MLIFLCFPPPGLLYVPSSISEGAGKQEVHQQGQRRVPTTAGEEQHRREKEPGQGSAEDHADPAEGPAAPGGKPEAAAADRTTDTGAGHSQTHPVAAAPPRSGGWSNRGNGYLEADARLSWYSWQVVGWRSDHRVEIVPLGCTKSQIKA